MKRIGIFGGTFDPIHIGHLTAAQLTLEKMRLDKIIFMPTSIPPHKEHKTMAPARQRLNLMRLAIRGHPQMEVSDYEIQKGGISYSIDTIRYFKKKFKKDTILYFIIGADLLKDLKTWRCIDEITRNVSFIVIHRPGFKKTRSQIHYHYVQVPGMDVSSSFIRLRVMQGKSIRYFLPESLVKYIFKHRLYQGSLV